MAKQEAKKVETPAPAVLDKKKPYEIVCGIPAISYRQDGKFFGANGKERELPETDKRTEAEKRLELLETENADLKQQLADLALEQSKRNLREVTPSVETAASAVVSPVITVDVVDGDVVSTPVEVAATA